MATVHAQAHPQPNYMGVFWWLLGLTIAEVAVAYAGLPKLIMIVLLGWQFALAEAVGAVVMVSILAILFRLFLRPALVDEARKQAVKGLRGKMEGHAEMDMAVTDGQIIKRILSSEGRTAISHYFVMDWIAVWKDIAGGLLIAGVFAAIVPTNVWRSLFLSSHPLLAQFWGPKGFASTVREIDPRPGGVFRIEMRGPDGAIYPCEGTYREVVAPER